MAKTLQNLVDAYKREEQSLPDGVTVPPASEAELQEVQRTFSERFRVELAPEYLELAALADGISAQGTFIYSVVPRRLIVPHTGEHISKPGIVDENTGWRLDDASGKMIRNWLIYGIGELEFIIQFVPSGKFQRRSRRDWNRVMDETDTFNDILWRSFEQRLCPLPATDGT